MANSKTGNVKAPIAKAPIAKARVIDSNGAKRDNAPKHLLRYWEMLAYLGHHDAVHIDTLANEFGISRAQVRKDLVALNSIDTPYNTGQYLAEYDPDALEEDNEVRLKIKHPVTIPIHVTDDEIAPLIAGLQALAISEFITTMPDRLEVVNSALAKLKEIAGPQADAIDLELPKVPNPLVAQTITSGILGGQRLLIEYVNVDDTVSRREIDPAVVVTQDRNAYLRAWCYTRKEARVFRMDRILRVTPLEMPVDQEKISTVTRDSDVSGETATAGTLEVVLTLKPSARWLAEELKGLVIDLPGGTFELHLKVASRSWLEGVLLGIAPHVIAVKPDDLAQDVASAAQAALANYSG